MLSARVLQVTSAVAVVLAVSAAAIGIALWVSQRPHFDLQRIELRGELQHVTSASVRAALAGRLRGNFFTVPLDETRRLLESVPWVASASVRRVWPDRLQVQLSEHRAMGVWGDGRLLSDHGLLFVANLAEAEIDAPLPEFSGPPAAAADAAAKFRDFSTRLAKAGLTVTAIEVSERRSWALLAWTVDGEMTRIELGRETAESPLSERLEHLATAYPIVVARLGGPPARIDARYPAGFAAVPAKSR
jgi:cell division protein FtsQ